MDREELRLRRAFVYLAVLAAAMLAIWLTWRAIQYFERKFLRGTTGIALVLA